jgi:hypothetical protein
MYDEYGAAVERFKVLLSFQAATEVTMKEKLSFFIHYESVMDLFFQDPCSPRIVGWLNNQTDYRK